MKGLHIYNRNLFRGRCENRIDYHFRDLYEPIAPALTQFYWVMLDEPFLHVAFDGQSFSATRYEAYLLQKFDRLRLLRRVFLQEFAKFIQGEWVQLYGFGYLPELADLQANMNFFENRLNPVFVAAQAAVYFSCYKGVYWEVFSREENLLQLLAENFANNVEITLR